MERSWDGTLKTEMLRHLSEFHGWGGLDHNTPDELEDLHTEDHEYNDGHRESFTSEEHVTDLI